jgi:hypothetical protein
MLTYKKKIMDKNTQTQLANLTIVGGLFLFVSSFWAEDKKTAVNRRWAGMILSGIGLVVKPLK